MAAAQYKNYCVEYGHPPSDPQHLRKFAARYHVQLKWMDCRQIIQNPPQNINRMTSNKSLCALDLALSTENLFKTISNEQFLFKDMDEWKVNDVHEWILSVEDNRLYFVAKQLQIKQIDGLRLMGVNDKYLSKLGIDKQDIQLLIKSRDEILNPPSIIKKPSGIGIQCTSLTEQSSNETVEETQPSTNHSNASKHKLPMINESLEFDLSDPSARPDENVERALDKQFISELVHVGLSEDIWTKSTSHYEQHAIFSPKSYRTQQPEQDAKDMAKKPQLKQQLTPAKLVEAKSKLQEENEQTLRNEIEEKSLLNAEAHEFYPNSLLPSQQRYCIPRTCSAPLATINEIESKLQRLSANSRQKKYKMDIYISRKFTKLIADTIKEQIPKANLLEYIQSSIRMQHSAQYNHGNIRIFDFDFHDKTGEKLYCMVEKTQNRNKGYREWTMKEALYTQQKIKAMNEFLEIPKSTRRTFDDLKVQHNELSDKITEELISKKTNWCKVPIYSKLNGKSRRTLAVNKKEFIARLKKNEEFISMKDIDLIPIIVFHHNHKFHIEYVQIVKIDKDVDIAISYRNDKKRGGISVSGIYVNKEELRDLHYLISPQHIANCHCFDRFTTNIDHLTIGNPDDQQNRINDQQKRIDNLKKEVNDLKNQLKSQQHRNQRLQQEIELRRELDVQQQQNQALMMMQLMKPKSIPYSLSTPQTYQTHSPLSNNSDSLSYDTNQ